MTDFAARYRRRADAVERTIAAVRPDQWPSQSPCAAWTARDVVAHLIDMHGAMLHPVGRSLSAAPAVADDPLGAFRAARADLEVVIGDRALTTSLCETPTGSMTVEEHIDRVVSDDMVVHRWDLARATGQDEAMDPDDVERLWALYTTMPPDLLDKLRTPGAFGPGIEVLGPEVAVVTDAPLQDRLLGLVGRDPR
ncbi:TIGR03086 family metal-binding protein [Saccharomonospora sp. NPDC046836]|uniref:TIGR03086 family metal-binding protein n=1 Tax=Saccharomonospora sp. NPDC046836 TaxID=3156921 RepID=UPI0033FA62D4